MLLDTLLIIGTLEKAIGDSAKVTFSSYGKDDRLFAGSLKVTAEWIIEKQVVRLEHIIPASQLAQANSSTEMESIVLGQFINKARAGYKVKREEIRTQMEKEIRNAAKT